MDAMSYAVAVGSPNRPKVSRNKRCLLFVGTWGIAILCCVIPGRRNPLNPFFLPFFTLGLIEWFRPNILDLLPPRGRGLELLLFFGLIAFVWSLYIVHGLFTLMSRSRTRFYLLLLILMLTLLLNVNGCRHLMSDSAYDY
jgi:hypothetical protein